MHEHHPTEAIILCGGLGTRFRSVFSDRPKTLAPIRERAFMDILLDYFLGHGIEKLILCTGYLSEYIEKYYSESPYKKYIEFSVEASPLGTAGAVKNAQQFIVGEHFFVANGDSFCRCDMPNFIEFHISQKNPCISIVISKNRGRTDAGNVRVDENSGRITSFSEKYGEREHEYINAGIYIFHKDALRYIPENKNFSIEKDLIPSLKEFGIYGFATEHEVIDIGTPERYEYAQKFFAPNFPSENI